MDTPQRTSEGKWILYLVSTGERVDRWPVDAKEMLARGAYSADDPHGSAGDVPAASVASAGESVPDATPAEAPAPNGINPVHLVAHAADATSPTGAPLVVAGAATASPAAPVQLPPGRTTAPRGRRGR